MPENVKELDEVPQHLRLLDTALLSLQSNITLGSSLLIHLASGIAHGEVLSWLRTADRANGLTILQGETPLAAIPLRHEVRATLLHKTLNNQLTRLSRLLTMLLKLAEVAVHDMHWGS